tara:strand:+ start:692 stop:817 length:126 start_codon:yes stop_codon:yes gene_type:complete
MNKVVTNVEDIPWWVCPVCIAILVAMVAISFAYAYLNEKEQ